VVVLKWGIIAAIAAFFISVFIGIIFDVRAVHIILRALLFAVLFFGLGIGLRFIINSYFPELLYKEDENPTEDWYDQVGSRQAITQDDVGEYAVPELYKTPDGSDELGNIDDLISGSFNPRDGTKGIDRNTEAGYNNKGDFNKTGQVSSSESQDISNVFPEEFPFHDDGLMDNAAAGSSPAVDRQQFSPSFGENAGYESLPDLDLMARAFSSGFGGAPVSIPPTPAQTFIPATAAANSSALSSNTPKLDELEPTPQRYRGGNKPQPMKGDFNPKELAEGLRSVLEKDK